jgi:hypothetical protein
MAKTIKGRKFVATAASAALVASAIVPVASAATSFADDAKISSFAKEAVEYLEAKGIFEGDANNNLNPLGQLSRAEATTLLVRVLGITVDESKKTSFADAANHWASEEIAALQAYNPEIIKGYEDGTFKPDGKITRAEFAKLIVTALDLKVVDNKVFNFTDITGHWAKPLVEALYTNGYANGVTTTTFGPDQALTREQAAVFLHRHLEPSKRLPVEDVAVATELTVASVSAINNTTFEVSVTFDKEVTASELTGKKLTLTNGSASVTATFKQLDGQTGVFVIDNKGTLQPGNGSVDGTYKVTSTDFAVKADTVTSYNESLVGNQVKGFVYDLSGTTPKPLANAIVEINGRTVATDSYGFYSIPSNAGSREVTVTAPGYTFDKATVNVSRNDVTVQNFEVTKLDVTKLEINGKAVDASDDAIIGSATVNLYEKASNGSWTKVGSTTSNTTTGEFKFANTGAGNSFAGTDEIETGKEYKVEIVKGLSAKNLDQVFHTKEVTVTASTSKEKNELGLVKLTKVKEVANFTLDLTWAADAVLPTTSTNVKVDLLTADGKTVLEGESISGTALSLTTDAKGLTQPYNLVTKSYFKNFGEDVPSTKE